MLLIGLQCVIVAFLGRTCSLLFAQVSDPAFVLSCVTQGAVLGPFLAFCSINDLSDTLGLLFALLFSICLSKKRPCKADVVCFLYST